MPDYVRVLRLLVLLTAAILPARIYAKDKIESAASIAQAAAGFGAISVDCSKIMYVNQPLADYYFNKQNQKGMENYTDIHYAKALRVEVMRITNAMETLTPEFVCNKFRELSRRNGTKLFDK